MKVPKLITATLLISLLLGCRSGDRAKNEGHIWLVKAEDHGFVKDDCNSVAETTRGICAADLEVTDLENRIETSFAIEPLCRGVILDSRGDDYDFAKSADWHLSIELSPRIPAHR